MIKELIFLSATLILLVSSLPVQDLVLVDNLPADTVAVEEDVGVDQDEVFQTAEARYGGYGHGHGGYGGHHGGYGGHHHHGGYGGGHHGGHHGYHRGGHHYG